MTKTARTEGLAKLPIIINRIFDLARIESPAVRESVHLKVRLRYLQLAKKSEFNDVESEFAKVKGLYDSFLKNPEMRARLVKLKEKKPNRVGLLPSEGDLRLLGEANKLSTENKVFFVTDDGDFIAFKDEIKQALNVNVIELLDLRGFSQSLKQSMKKTDSEGTPSLPRLG